MRSFGANRLKIRLHHLSHEIGERRLRIPPQFPSRLGGVTQQGIDLGRTEIAPIDFDHHPAGGGIEALLAVAVALPGDVASHLRESELDEFS